ncbi:MAG: response regulator transcription factor, partial [Clostridia bacterium]|nr:response regulator transcription factor [Clostridia bacterium]
YALNSFPNLDWMTEQYKAAEKLMTAPSKIFIKEEPFMFGCASMWYLFYNEPGKMLETADKLAAAMKIYNRLTNGHGAGAAEIYRGEALSVQGRFEESDIQAYQAAFLSEQSGNATATYGAALLLGINAIYRSDMVGLQKAVDYLENKAQSYSFLRGRTLGTYMVETVRGYLLGLMMETGRSALWTQGEADSLTDLTFTNFMIKTCRITDLLLKKEYKQAIASVEAALQLDRRLISVSTKNFMYCGLALGYLAIGRPLRAAEYLEKSLTIAGQDKNYTFLACFRKYFQVLFLMPQIASKHAKTIREIKALDIRYTRADESHIFEMLEEVPELREELTAREREVAELAAKGLRNAEIAEALFISENTVKHHLKIAFQKMNIDRRSRLIDMLR